MISTVNKLRMRDINTLFKDMKVATSEEITVKKYSKIISTIV